VYDGQFQLGHTVFAEKHCS